MSTTRAPAALSRPALKPVPAAQAETFEEQITNSPMRKAQARQAFQEARREGALGDALTHVKGRVEVTLADGTVVTRN